MEKHYINKGTGPSGQAQGIRVWPSDLHDLRGLHDDDLIPDIFQVTNWFSNALWSAMKTYI